MPRLIAAVLSLALAFLPGCESIAQAALFGRWGERGKVESLRPADRIESSDVPAVGAVDSDAVGKDLAVDEAVRGEPCAACSLARTGEAIAEPHEEGPKTAVDRLFLGERVYAPEDEHFVVDEPTLADLEVFKPEDAENDPKAPPHHLYDQLNRTYTAWGSNRLEWLLRHPLTDAAAIRKRQDAVEAMIQDPALRRDVQAAMAPLKGLADENMMAHFDDPFWKESDPKWTKRVLVTSNFVGLFPPLVAFLVLNQGLWGILSNAQLIIAMVQFSGFWLASLMTVRPMIKDLRRMLSAYQRAFQAADKLSSVLSSNGSQALREIGGTFSAAKDRRHPLGVHRIAGRFLRLWSNAAAYAPDTLYMHSAKTLWSLLWDLRRNRERIAPLLGALAELDVHLTFAEAALRGHRHGAYVRPEVSDAEKPSLELEEAHHPALALAADSVANDVILTLNLGGEHNFLVFTGPNMGGKTTYVKTAQLIALMTQIGAWVPARKVRATPLEFMSSVDIGDSLEKGKSFFDAETDRIKEILDRAIAAKRLFVIMDEILLGTNPQERTALERSIIRYLAKTGNLFILATHDRKMSQLEGDVPGLGNIHVEEERIEGDKMTLSHRVLPGPATSRNAVKIAKMKEFPREITAEAEAWLREHPED